MSSVISSFAVQAAADLQHQAHRFTAWVALFSFSAVCLTAAQSHETDKWSLSCACISLILSFLAATSYLVLRRQFVGRAVEAATALLQVMVWSAGWPFLMKVAISSRHDEGGRTEIINVNVYFFTWLSLATSLYILAHVARDAVAKLPHSLDLTGWLGLCGSSTIVVCSAIAVLQDTNSCQLQALSETEYCRRTRAAVGVGLASLLVAVTVTALLATGRRLLLASEFSTTTFLLTLWCLGVGYITFGNSPGATISNLYFAAWLSLALVVGLFAQNFREFVASHMLDDDADLTTAPSDEPVDVDGKESA